MKIKLAYKDWKKVKKKLKLIQLDPKINYKGDVKHQYVSHFYKDCRYPRFHLETRFIHPAAHIVEIHIDWVQHKESDGFHPLIENFVNKIKQMI